MTPLSLSIDNIKLINKKIQQKGCLFVYHSYRFVNLLHTLGLFFLICLLGYLIGFFFPWKASVLFFIPVIVSSLLLLKWKYKKPEGFFFLRSGVGYQTPTFTIFFPWKAIIYSQWKENGQLSIHLNSDTKGIGYMILSCSSTKPSETLDLDKRVCTVSWTHNQLFLKEISFIINEHAMHGIKNDYLSKIKIISLERRLIETDIFSSFNFPMFCPSSKHPCDSFFSIPILNSSKKFLWFMSPQGTQKEKWFDRIRKITPLLLLLIYFFFTYWLLLFINVTLLESIPIFLGSLPFFLLYPLTVYLLRPSIQCEKQENTQKITIQFRDEDYFLSFLGLNTT